MNHRLWLLTHGLPPPQAPHDCPGGTTVHTDVGLASTLAPQLLECLLPMAFPLLHIRHPLPCLALNFVIICNYCPSKKTTSNTALSTSSSSYSFMAQLVPPNLSLVSLLSSHSSILPCLDFSPISSLLCSIVYHPITFFAKTQILLSLSLTHCIWQTPALDGASRAPSLCAGSQALWWW